MNDKKKIYTCLHIACVLISAILFIIALSIYIPYRPPSLQHHDFTSTEIYDRNDVLLRRVLSTRQETSMWVEDAKIPVNLKNAFLAAEDKRFYSHHGIDGLALMRAFKERFESGRFLSGASTITQQVIRAIRGREKRNIATKFMENWLALRLDNSMNKSSILEQYLNRVPMGNELYGIGAASEIYFRKPVRELTTAEAALLAAIPKSPAGYNPYRYYQRAIERQKKILKLMLKNRYISETEYNRINDQDIVVTTRDAQFKAPHLCDLIVSGMQSVENRPVRVQSTIDWQHQRNIQDYVTGHLIALQGHNVNNAAVLVVENKTGNIIIWLGSQDYFDNLHAGQVDGIRALRQPGSALKPFTYGLALFNGYTAASVIPDLKFHAREAAGFYTPQNYDHKYHGPVTVRRALACSYNIPPVRILDELGEEALLKLLHDAGFSSLDKPASYYGKGLTLGNGEVTLLELVRAYAGLVNHGQIPDIHIVETESNAPFFGLSGTVDPPKKILTPAICSILIDILSDNDARTPAFGRFSPLKCAFDCAAKTGTSKDYRDNWAIGCTSDLTAGVWVGNFSGESMHHVSGVSGAGPILNDVLHYLDRYYHFSAFEEAAGLTRCEVCALSGKLPNGSCPSRITELFELDKTPEDTCTWHRRVHAQTGPSGGRAERADVYLDLPTLYDSWMKENGLNIMRTVEQSRTVATTQNDDAAGRFRILSPKDGDIFKIDSILRPDFQRIQLKAEVPESIQKVRWYIDGELLGSYGFPHSMSWKLHEGKHRIMAIGDGGVSDTVKILVLP